MSSGRENIPTQPSTNVPPTQNAQTSHSADWSLKNTVDDPLLESLVLITKYYRRPVSVNALRDGLPLENGKFTPELFVRSAKRADLSAKIVSRKIKSVNNFLLPAVLIMKNKRVVVLSSIDKKKDSAIIICPETIGESRNVSLKELTDDYLGFAIFVKPKFKFDDRAEEILGDNSGHWFWSTISQSWRIYTDVIIASLLINIFAVVSPLFIMNVYDRIIPNNAKESLWMLAIGVFIVFLFDFIMKITRSNFIDVAGKKSDILVSSKIFEKVMGIKFAEKPISTGSFAKNIQEFDSIRDFITSTTITAFIDIPFVILFLTLISYFAGWLVAVPISGILIMVTVSLILQSPIKHAVEQTSKSASQKSATLVESISGLEVIKINNAEGEQLKKWEKNIDYMAHWSKKTKKLSALITQMAGFITQMNTLVIVVFGVYLISDQKMSVGALIASVLLSGRIMGPMTAVTGLATRYNQAKAALVSLESIMSLGDERDPDRRYISRANFKGQIALENLSFAYPSQSEKLILSNINLHIKPGEKVGIIGRVGSGKSTLGRLLVGLYESEHGAIKIDNIDIRQINPGDLRRQVGYLTQDCRLFFGTVRENLTMGAEYIDDQSIIHAAEVSGVSDFTNNHPSGMDMMVAEGGANLSGGQKQQISLGRSILLDPSILILDEPTAQMDIVTEEMMKVKLKVYAQHKTLLLITHKISTLKIIDRLIILEKGQIIADGPRQAIVERLQKGELKLS